MRNQLIGRVYNVPHLLRPEKLEAIRAVLTDHAFGLRADAATIAAVVADNRQRQSPAVADSVAVLPIYGTLAKRMDMMGESSGGTSVDRLAAEFDRLVADSSVGAIVLDIDSPGGESFGISEFAEKIYAARASKPIEAVVNAEMASGALWLGSAAGSISITPSGWAGSLGAYMVHTDASEWLAAEGVKVTYLSSAPEKVEMAGEVPLSKEAASYYQGMVDSLYRQFVGAVAKYRGLSSAAVVDRFGKGRMLMAQEAVASGMVDRIATLDDVIQRQVAGIRQRRGATAKARIARERLDLEVYR